MKTRSAAMSHKALSVQGRTRMLAKLGRGLRVWPLRSSPAVRRTVSGHICNNASCRHASPIQNSSLNADGDTSTRNVCLHRNIFKAHLFYANGSRSKGVITVVFEITYPIASGEWYTRFICIMSSVNLFLVEY